MGGARAWARSRSCSTRRTPLILDIRCNNYSLFPLLSKFWFNSMRFIITRYTPMKHKQSRSTSTLSFPHLSTSMSSRACFLRGLRSFHTYSDPSLESIGTAALSQPWISAAYFLSFQLLHESVNHRLAEVSVPRQRPCVIFARWLVASDAQPLTKCSFWHPPQSSRKVFRILVDHASRPYFGSSALQWISKCSKALLRFLVWFRNEEPIGGGYFVRA